MSYEEIKADAKKYAGMEFSMATFRFAFGQGEKLMNRLIASGIIEVAGEYPNNGRPCLKYRVK